MNVTSTIEWLSNAITKATRSANFCVVGRLPAIDPGIEVEGAGAFKLPLKRAAAKELVDHCRDAPYGKGTQTLVDKRVRRALELDATEFRLSGAWDVAIAAALPSVAERLGLPADQLEAKLYKLLVHEKGGFFQPHRDSEKDDRMVASMIVVLPNQFDGGNLVVRHRSAEQTLTFEEATGAKVPCYAAFYADCEHEVKRVTRGLRLSLAYNLVLKPKTRKRSSAAQPVAPDNLLADSIRSWITTRGAEPLVFALEHHYTQRGLSPELLKGADRRLADLVAAGAEKADCLVHFAQVSRHLLQFADDGSFGEGYSRYYREPRRRELEIGETYEDDLNGSQWTDARGKKQPWGEIAFDPSAVVASVPIDDWKPTSEEFEGYTGNEGNSLDRWYHRSAIVVWHRDHHFEVIARSGATECIPLLRSMVKKLAKTPKKRLEAARSDCIRFARAIIGQWPQYWVGYAYRERDAAPTREDLPDLLLTLHDRSTIAAFLSQLAERDDSLPLKSFVIAACREHGWSAFGRELQELIASGDNERGRRKIPLRDVEWLAAYCLERNESTDRTELAHKLCALAVERFCEPRERRPSYYWPAERTSMTIEQTSLTLLLKALAASGRDDDLARVVQFVRETRDEFSTRDCQVPCLKELIPWCRKRFDLVHPHFLTWLSDVREELESATAQKPAPPTDWARPADVTCTCQYCGRLNAFLADPANEVGRIAARADLRDHVIGSIRQHKCDVRHVLERKGSPYALVLTKTTGSFERATTRFEANRKALSALRGLEDSP